MNLSKEEFIAHMNEPFAPNEIEWKLQAENAESSKGLVVPYIDSRAIQKRLDDVVGPTNWRAEYRQWKNNSQLCGIAIYDSEKQEWITKWDGADDTDFQSTKGGLSSSFKRAATLWGIGRYLYSLDGVWLKIEYKTYKGKQRAKVAANQEDKIDNHYASEIRKYLLRTGSPTTSKPAGQNSRSTQEKNSSNKPKPQPPQMQPQQKIYLILGSELCDGMRIVYLQTPGGKKIKAYAADNAHLVKGAALENVLIETRGEGQNKYYYLGRYKFRDAAA
ncbi:hypothetical protein LJC32_01995 [Oscillospiraceae bacterium OttesenSCG-928-F05]|nr:hypothetical protein [Oscillospiraceae bacterium OttesenSCG-928-F05]